MGTGHFLVLFFVPGETPPVVRAFAYCGPSA